VSEHIAMSLIDDFDWKTAKLNTLGAALVVAFAYLFIVIGFVSTKEVRQVFNFTLPGKLIPYYNLFLSIASLVMFSGTLIFTIERVSEEGWEWLLCEKCYEAKGPLWFFSYLYYLSKYYELLDTILLLFSGKMPANLFQNVRTNVSP
jgi:fatty acid elongase 3